MSAAQRMRDRLNATGCYRMTGETTADWETNACGSEIDRMEEKIDALLADLFPATAGEEQLAQWEALFRPMPAAEDVETRRAMIEKRLGMRPDAFRPEVLTELLCAAGMLGMVQESDGGIKLLLGRLLDLPEAEIRRELDQLLPAHLTWAFSDEMTWLAVDALTRTFETWDRQGWSWTQLEALSREDMENMSEE